MSVNALTALLLPAAWLAIAAPPAPAEAQRQAQAACGPVIGS